MVLPGTSPGSVRLLAEKVRRAVQGLAIAHSGSPALDCVTVSIGGAVLVPQPDAQPSQLVKAADAGLYQAKRNGRYQVMMSQA